MLMLLSLVCILGTLLDGKPIVNLPPKTIRLDKVEFSREERAFYAQLEASSRSKFKVFFFAYLCFSSLSGAFVAYGFLI